MVLHRLILNAIKKSLISGRALMTCLRANKLASIVGSHAGTEFTLNMRSESPRKVPERPLIVPETSAFLRDEGKGIELNGVNSVSVSVATLESMCTK
jgi:hypothetical protein